MSRAARIVQLALKNQGKPTNVVKPLGAATSPKVNVAVNNEHFNATINDTDITCLNFQSEEVVYEENKSNTANPNYDVKNDETSIENLLTQDNNVHISNENRDEEPNNHYCEDINVDDLYVSATSHNGGKRVYDKRHYCLYCDKPFIKLARHLESVHSEEMGVAKILAYDKGSEARRNAFINITRVGDFHHNIEVLTLKRGELVLVRRPPTMEKLEIKNFGPCPQCLGFLHKRHLWHHAKSCNKRKDSTDSDNRISISLESNALLNSIIYSGTSKSFQDNILNHLSNNEVSEKVKSDDTIVRFGSFMFDKFGTTQNELIRQSMRQLGRLLIVLQKKTSEEKNLKDFFQPIQFDIVVQGVRELCIEERESDAVRPQFQIPSLAMKLGYHLRKCASLQRGLAMRSGDMLLDGQLQSFLTLMEMEWSTRISSNAISTLITRKRNAVNLLPLTTDLIKLTEYCKTKMRELKLQLKQHPEAKTWNDLARITLTRLVVFNKRRGGETSKLLVFDYNNRIDWKKESTQELQCSLSSLERDLAGKLTLIQITGKRGRTVPLLIPKDVNRCIRLLLQTREAIGIKEDNPYVFSRVFSNFQTHLRGSDCLRKVCTDANLQMPQNVSSTRLRKYIATVCQIFSLKENEMGWLARHLGHELNVHRQFYSLHESAVELTKISRLLMVVDQGVAHQFAGKTLDQISLEDLPQIEEEDNIGDIESSKERPTESCENNEETEDPTFSIHVSKKARITTEEMSDSTKKHTNRRNTEKKPWSAEEKSAVLSFLKRWVKKGIVPRKEDCMQCLGAHATVLKTRTWKDVKFCVKNQLDRIKRAANKNVPQ